MFLFDFEQGEKDNREWVKTWDISIKVPKKMNGKWKLDWAHFHKEKTYKVKVKPKKIQENQGVFRFEWRSRKGKFHFKFNRGK